MSLALKQECAPQGARALDGYWNSASPRHASRHSHVTLIGAGIVGLTTAAALVRTGRSVTVIDALPGPGQGASQGNGCQLSYGYVAPLANQSLWADLPHLLLARTSPLKIVPRLDLAQWSWLIAFLRACTARRSSRSTEQLLALAQLSREQTRQWLAQSDCSQLNYAEYGKIVVLPNEAAFAKAVAQAKLQTGLGPVQHALSAEECLRLEPALHRFRGRMAGAIHTPSECAIDSLALCRNLARQLQARQVQFHFSTQVQGFERAQGRVIRAFTDQGVHEIDGLVIAAGVGSRALARMLGFAVPIYPMKGYSLSGQIVDEDGVPKASITDAARKVVYARIGKRLRIAGFAELQGYACDIDPAKIERLTRGTHELFGSAVQIDPASAWAGLRPMTPTSVPIIRQSPVANVFLNVGQGALGLTLAFGCAHRLADLIDAP